MPKKNRLISWDDAALQCLCPVHGLAPLRLRVRDGWWRRSCRICDGGRALTPAGRREKKYGLTPTAFDQLVLAQTGRCAICLVELIELAVDHDHLTNTVRGLLCPACNKGLGHFKDSVSALLQAAAYLA